MELDLPHNFQGSLRRVGATFIFKPHTQYAVKHQRQKTNHRMSADSIRATVEHWRDLNL